MERTAIGRTDLVVGSITPTIIAQLQETAEAFQKDLIPQPIVARDAVRLVTARRLTGQPRPISCEPVAARAHGST